MRFSSPSAMAKRCLLDREVNPVNMKLVTQYSDYRKKFRVFFAVAPVVGRGKICGSSASNDAS
jgi:hypothetical protein